VIALHYTTPLAALDSPRSNVVNLVIAELSGGVIDSHGGKRSF
jgi:hypothetical protein